MWRNLASGKDQQTLALRNQDHYTSVKLQGAEFNLRDLHHVGFEADTIEHGRLCWTG